LHSSGAPVAIVFGIGGVFLGRGGVFFFFFRLE
jgi:hypothetical protein